jgi:hypothetical protein
MTEDDKGKRVWVSDGILNPSINFFPLRHLTFLQTIPNEVKPVHASSPPAINDPEN